MSLSFKLSSKRVLISCLLGTLFSPGWSGAAAVPGSGNWESSLHARDINQDGLVDAYYDADLNITWLADAFSDAPPPGRSPGRPILYWSEAQEWVSSLDVHGVKGWRLPQLVNDPDATAPGYRSCPGEAFDGSANGLCGYNNDASRSELAHMYYITLGNKAILGLDGLPQADAGLVNTGPFDDLAPNSYFSRTRNEPGDFVWMFAMSSGVQFVGDPFGGGFRPGVWAVRDGDVAAVPEASVVSMLVGGLLVLLGVGRQRLGLLRRR